MGEQKDGSGVFDGTGSEGGSRTSGGGLKQCCCKFIVASQCVLAFELAEVVLFLFLCV